MKITTKGVDAEFSVGENIADAIQLYGEEDVFDLYVKGCRQNLRQHLQTHGPEKTTKEYRPGAGIRRPASIADKLTDGFKEATMEERAKFLANIKEMQ